MVLPLLKIAGGAVVHLCFAVMAVDKPGKQITLARLCPPMPLLAYRLHLAEHFRVDNRLMRPIENGLLFDGVIPLLLVPDGIGVGLEVHRTACVLLPFKDMDNGVGIPVIGVGALLAGGVASLSHLVGGGVEYLFILEQLGNLQGASALHTKGEYPLDDCRRFFVYKPLSLVIRVADIAVGDIGSKPLAALALCFIYRPDFAAGISGVKLVKPVLDPGEVVIHAVGVDGVVVVIDGDKSHAMLGKGEVDIHSRHSRVSCKAAEVFDDDNAHPVSFDVLQHFQKTGAFKAGAGVSVVHEKAEIGEAVFLCKAFQYHALVPDGIALPVQRVLLRKAAVESCDFFSCP